ncbi:E3 ubiquitin-protein ligase APD2-like [Actinidia eriantha]|uniref:E3 ubiquitin-protein ligase APD2-like n=1 Tax=Actinidia eriantha TaxID=165200 RepID=UPI00258BDC8A|nr:E3 ubiquitin-protein ligase APD2-like [Actinidia eriantha]XP_057498552.1 E3 ubiquitin-protein ligase APD2-like [Actinidia eriantha]
MEQPDRNSTEQASSSSYSTNREFPGEATTSYSSSSQVREEEAEAEDRDPSSEFFQQQTGVAYHVHYATAEDEEVSTMIRDDTWSCIIVVLTFWFFVSMTLILGVYGSVNLQLGPYSSFLIQPNSLFVEYIKVEQSDDAKTGPVLYGFYEVPPRDVLTTWSENHSIPLSAGLYKEWIYVLNEGSQVNISYSVNSPSSSSLIVIIAQGSEGFAQWLEDPSYPNTTLSWNIIHGSGTIHQDIYLASSYYVAVGNLNSEEVEVQLNLSMKAFLYNTTKAYYNCAVAQGACSLKMFFSDANAAVLTSPGPEQDSTNDMWYVKLSYGPRWITYLLGIGVMTVLMLLAFHFLNNFQCSREEGTRYQFGETRSERAPLLSQKDDDLSSWGSSYDSVSQDEEDLEDGMPVTSLEGKPLKDGEYNNNIRRLCAICFDAPRDCFFLPCGHCVACFACGTRIAELAGTCPICRRNMKKVRRIFSV